MIFLYRLLRGKKYRQSKARRYDPAHPPQPLRWRPKLKVYGLVTGLIGGLGAVILVAQYGVEPLTTRALSTRGILGAALSGLVMPSLVFGLVVWRFNRKLRRGPAPGRPRRRLAAAGAGGIWLATVLLGVAFASSAGAYVNGPCSATFVGVEADGLTTTSAGDSIEVPEGGIVTYAMSAPDGLASWRFTIHYGPYSETIAEGRARESGGERSGDGGQTDLGLGEIGENLAGGATLDGNTVSGAAEVDDYAWLGSGLYEVRGSVVTNSGDACTGAVLIDVEGNPLTTVIGGAAAAATVIGAVGVGLVTVNGLRDGGELLDALDGFEADSTGGDEDRDDHLEDWEREELAERERIRQEVMGAAEADWERRKVGFDAERAAADAAVLEEIRAGRERIAAAETYAERRERILEQLEAAEGEQASMDEWDEWWQGVRDDAFDGMVRDIDSLPTFVREAGAATRQRIGEAYDVVTDPESWRVAAEAAAETVYDASGMMAGGAWGSGADKAGESFNDAVEFGAKVAQAAANDPIGFAKQVTPIADFEAAIDPDLPLGERLTRLGTGLVDVGVTLAGGGVLKGADALDDASDAVRVARAAENADDVADLGRAGRVADAMDDSADVGRATASADDLIARGRAAGAGDEAFDARRTAWAENRRAGRESVDEFARAVESGDDATLAALKVQSNKQGLGAMKNADDALKARFNDEMRRIYDETDAKVLQRARTHIDEHVLAGKGKLGDLRPATTDELADYLRHDRNARLRQANGRVTVLRDENGNFVELFEPTNPKPGVNVGADRDFTVYVKTAEPELSPGATLRQQQLAEWRSSRPAQSLPHDQVEEWYREGFVDAVGRDNLEKLGISESDALARFDQAVTSDFHGEAYTNVDRVMGAPGAALDDAQQVGMTIGFKGDHGFGVAEDLRASGNLAAAEDAMAEASRQLTKQFDNQVTGKLDAIRAQVDELKAAGALPADYVVKPPPPQLQSAVDVMRRVQSDGLSPVEMERALQQLGMTPRDVSRELGSYYESLQQLAPSPVRSVQQSLIGTGG